mgnify:CR=1 FL=1
MLATSSNSGAATPRPVAQTPGGAGAAATPATAPRGSVDGALPLRIPFRTEKQGKSPQVPGRADGTRGKGKGVVNAATAASALRSTQNNTVLLADLLRRLAVQEARAQGARRIHRLQVRVGALAGVDADALRLAFEVLVAFLQAYIFTILASVYIGSAAHPEH